MLSSMRRMVCARYREWLGVELAALPEPLFPAPLNSFCGLFDQRSYCIRLRYVNRVTARYLDDGRPRTLGHKTLGRRWNHPIVGGDQVPARLGLPRRLTDCPV